MGTRELLILILGLAVVAVILRGLYLALNARRSQIRLAIEKNIPQDLDIEELEMAELPNGGARVVRRSLDAVNRQNIVQNELDLGSETNLEEAIPILLDPVEIKHQVARDKLIDESEHFDSYDHEDETSDSRLETDWVDDIEDPTSQEDIEEPESYVDDDGIESNDQSIWESTSEPGSEYATDYEEDESSFQEPNIGEVESSDDDDFGDFSMTAGERIGALEFSSVEVAETEQIRQPLDRTELEVENRAIEVADINQARESKRPATSKAAPSHASKQAEEPAEVLVVNVMSHDGELFAGSDLLQVLISAGLKHGDMNIFHKHLHNDIDGPTIFSVANILNPGTFDLDAMEEISIRGISLFLAMPSVISNRDAFEEMLRTAQQIRAALGGELRDDHRSVMTPQTIEHYRQRIHDYELRKLKAAQSRC